MPGKGTQYQSPLVLQLVKNREVQRAAEAQKNSEEPNHGIRFFTRQPKEGFDYDPVMEWVGVFFRIFWLSLLSGSLFLDMGICLKVCRLLVDRL